MKRVAFGASAATFVVSLGLLLASALAWQGLEFRTPGMVPQWGIYYYLVWMASSLWLSVADHAAHAHRHPSPPGMPSRTGSRST
jgi:hypothetical protein